MAELAVGGDVSRLARLQVADEVPAERVPVKRVLGFEILEPVLADDRDPGCGQNAEVVRTDVLRGGDDGHLRPDLRADALVVRADGAYRESLINHRLQFAWGRPPSDSKRN